MKCYDVSRLPSMIELGFDGENNWRPNSFDCSSLLKNHPSGVISLWLLPNGESQAFPVALERDGNTVVWTPLSEEMTAEHGALQIVCTDGTDVGKSAVVMFRVSESIVPGAEHPAAVPSWATQTIERAEAAADRAEEAADSIDIDAIEAMIAQAIVDYLEKHPIEAPVQSVNGMTGAVNLDANDVGAVSTGTYTTDMALVHTELGAKLNTADLVTALDDVDGITYVLALNGATVTLDRPFVAVANSLLSTARRVMFVVILAESGGDPVKFLSLTPTLLDTNNRLLTLVGEHNGSRYTAELTAASASSTMTGTLVTEPIVTQSDIPSLTGYATETWVEGKGYLTQHQDISGKADKTPRVVKTASDTTPTLDPNKLYVFPEMTTLTPTFATPTDSTIVNEYHFIFTSGATATTLTLPTSVLQPDGFTVETNHVYEVSIMEGNMTAQGWAVSA